MPLCAKLLNSVFPIIQILYTVFRAATMQIEQCIYTVKSKQRKSRLEITLIVFMAKINNTTVNGASIKNYDQTKVLHVVC